MPIRTINLPSVADIGDTVRAWIIVVDNDGVQLTADSVTVDVTLPDESADTGSATEQDTTGLYLCTYDLTASGRHLFAVTVTSASAGDDVATFTVDVAGLTGSIPDMSAVAIYLGEDCSYTDTEIQDALDAETVAQARRCTIPASYPEDLAQALKRRVARNLAARSVPVASWTSFEGGATGTRVTKLDAEVERLEAPYRKWVIA